MQKSPSALLRVEAPHFVAGLIVHNGRVVETAPILRWANGKSVEAVLDYFDRRGYKVQWGR